MSTPASNAFTTCVKLSAHSRYVLRLTGAPGPVICWSIGTSFTLWSLLTAFINSDIVELLADNWD